MILNNTFCRFQLRLLDTFASKIAKICNFWTFRLVPFQYRLFFSVQNVLRLQIFAIFEAKVSSNLKVSTQKK